MRGFVQRCCRGVRVRHDSGGADLVSSAEGAMMEWNAKRKRIAELEREAAELREDVTYWQAVAEHNAKAGEWWRGLFFERHEANIH